MPLFETTRTIRNLVIAAAALHLVAAGLLWGGLSTLAWSVWAIALVVQGCLLWVIFTPLISPQCAGSQNERPTDAKHIESLIESCRDLVWRISMDGKITFASPSVREMMGYSPDEVLGIGFTELLAKESIPVAQKSLQQRLAGELPLEGVDLKLTLLHKNSHTIPTETRTCVIRDDLGNPIEIQGITRDVSQLRKSEQELRESRAKFAAFFRYSPDAFVLSRCEDGTILEANEAFHRISGYSAEEVVGKTSFAMDLWTQIDDRQKIISQIRQRGEVVNYQCHFNIKSGKDLIALVSGRIVSIQEEKCIIWIVRDITERVRNEQERAALLRRQYQAHKNESLGVMAGGIAHDFNNFLQIIIGNLELTIADLPEDSVASGRVQEALRTSQNASKLVQKILAYVGKEHRPASVLDVNKVLRNLLPLIHMTLPKEIELKIDLDNRNLLASSDQEQFEQVIMNLLLNAAESYQQQDGKVLLRTFTAELSADDLLHTCTPNHPSPGQYVGIEIKDSGKGMSAEEVERVLEPFFSTKFTGRGMGMSVVSGFIVSWDGALVIDSSPNHGTAVKIYLPHLNDQD